MRSAPQRYRPVPPAAGTTRWHGTTTASGIGSAGAGDRAGRAGCAYHRGHLARRSRTPLRDPLQRAPDAALERGRAHVERQIARGGGLAARAAATRRPRCRGASRRPRGGRRRETPPAARQPAPRPSRRVTPRSRRARWRRRARLPRWHGAVVNRSSSPAPPRRYCAGVMPSARAACSYTRLEEPNPASNVASAIVRPLTKARLEPRELACGGIVAR